MQNLFPGVCLFFVLCLLSACTDPETGTMSDGKSVQEVKVAEGVSNADLIRSPITADDANRDTVNVANIEFDQMIHNYGVISQGDVVKHTFKFTNTGRIPLIIMDAKTTCGCTVPKFPEDAIQPGESGNIQVKFNTASKKAGRHKPPITIVANTYPNETVIYMDGMVTD